MVANIIKELMERTLTLQGIECKFVLLSLGQTAEKQANSSWF